ncbi:g protein-coupled receptor [Anaeramoeba ignava]|uniref:G protein-coupled receptor n=1 Tax=Anaeramoeba ignava TaxID=1746090 RepID=A0A9Q0RCB7_ANAIG|nr:g protein-coupled receptor [Anaeramoeba ignava]
MIHNKESIPTIIGSTLGMTGSLLFIIVYSFIKEIRDPARKFIFNLAIYDFFFGIFAIIPGPISYDLCQIQGFFYSFTFGASCSFIFLISLVFYLKICYGKNVDESKKFFIIGNIIIFIICLIAASIFVIFGKVGSGDAHWCWITKSQFEPVIYIIVWFSLLGALTLYTIIFFKIRKNPNFSKAFQYKMFALGWVYTLTEIWTSIKRIRQMINPDAKDNEFLDLSQAFIGPMLGLWDSVFFVFGDKTVRSFIKAKLKKRKYDELKIGLKENERNMEFSIQNENESDFDF